ncbi:MAG: helix-turn-helix protein [Paenibacillus sp.]|jgi:AraC family transcriptional regulator of arabinose operon|nr:helix-turn-helix protein [Paenibacillus sp.]
MANTYLFHFDSETESPALGILLADHFHKSYGFQGHRSKGTKDWLMIYTVSGSGSFRVDRKVQVCGQGDVAILPPGIPHHYAANEEGGWELLWSHFIPLPEWNHWLQLPRTEEQLYYLHIHDKSVQLRIEQAFNRLIHDSRKTGKSNQDLAMLALAEILILLHQSHLQQVDNQPLDERIDDVLHYMLEHLHQKLSLAEVASKAGLSESRFCHLIKEQTGETYVELLTKMRLQKAAKLLAFTNRRIYQIASDVGFDSAYYFTRRFTLHYGVSPTAYRGHIQQQ